MVADLGGCFLAADLGIVPELEPRPDHASYWPNWLEILEREALHFAAARASTRRQLSARSQPGATQVAEAA